MMNEGRNLVMIIRLFAYKFDHYKNTFQTAACEVPISLHSILLVNILLSVVSEGLVRQYTQHCTAQPRCLCDPLIYIG